MNKDGHRWSRRRKLKWIAVCAPCFLVLYGLSIGPVAKLEDNGMISEQTSDVLGFLYAPLKPLTAIPSMRPIFNWYIFHVWNVDTMGDNTL